MGPTSALAVIVLVVLAVLALLLAQLLCRRRERAVAGGGPKDVVVDTLNLVHWLRRRVPGGRIGTCDILGAIDAATPGIRRAYPGRVTFVTKTRETEETPVMKARLRALYQAAAQRNGVHIHVVENLPGQKKASADHSALGRDDFYIALLAKRYRCPVISRDHYRDLAQMKKGALSTFHVYSYSPTKKTADRDFVNPSAAEFGRLRRPKTVEPGDVMPHF